MRRRALLRGTATAGAGGVLALVGLRVGSEPADAQASAGLSVGDETATVGPDGSVTAVTLDLTVEWSFDLPSGVQPAETVTTVRAGQPDGELTELARETGTTLFREDSGSTAVSADLLAEGVVTASELAPGAGTRETDVVIEAQFEVRNDAGTALASATASDTPTLTVERTGFEASDYGSVGGSGSLTIETG
jgi:outer membrane protein assembly factor BamB